MLEKCSDHEAQPGDELEGMHYDFLPPLHRHFYL